MAKQKRKVAMPAGIRNKMMAAVSMLLVSSIMMVSSTYAWFTLSTAPEVKNISTTVAGNGSLEIALMPMSGNFAEIGTGTGTSLDGTAGAKVANTTWGNLITLSGGTTDTDYYGLNQVTLVPASLDIAKNPESPLKTAIYGADGRVSDLTANTKLLTYDGGFTETTTAAPAYGVRAIGEQIIGDTSTYGYVIDFAVRINTTKSDGKQAALKLQTKAAQRVYSDVENPYTMGGGSSMKLSSLATGLKDEYVKELLKSIRITFVENYGKSRGTDEAVTILGEARLDTGNINVITASSEIPLYLYKAPASSGESGSEGTASVPTIDETGILIDKLAKNKARQISAIVWLDGENMKNASVAANALNSMQGTLNLQFSTDADLKPAQNVGLMNATGDSTTDTSTQTTVETPGNNETVTNE